MMAEEHRSQRIDHHGLHWMAGCNLKMVAGCNYLMRMVDRILRKVHHNQKSLVEDI